MSPLPRQGWLFLIEFLKWYFLKYWQVRTRPVFTQIVTYMEGTMKGLVVGITVAAMLGLAAEVTERALQRFAADET